MNQDRYRRRKALALMLGVILGLACATPGLYVSPAPAAVSWSDDVISIQVRVQQNLLAVATIVNNTSIPQVVPAPILSEGSSLNSYELMNSSGDEIRTLAPHGDWLLEARPMLELPEGGNYSVAIDLREMFPAFSPGTYRLRFVLGAIKGDRATWRGAAELAPNSFDVVR